MAQLPAVVTIQDLPTGTTITGAELLEAVQTAGGIGQSIQVPISQIATTALGGLPTGGGTGQVLLSSGTGRLSQWANIASNVLASTGLAQSGSTTVSLSLASTAGLSVLGVGGTGSAVPTAIAGTGAQVFRINDGATAAGFGAVNLGSTAAVTGVLPGANYSAVNLAATGAGGVQGVLPGANYSATNLAAGNVAGGVQGLLPPGSVATTGGAVGQVLAINPAGTTVAFFGGMVLLNTLSPNNVATAGDTTSFTANFRTYKITFENVVPANNDVLFQVQVATSGVNFISGNYISMATVDSLAIVSDTYTTALLLSGNRSTTTVGNGTTYGVHGFMEIYNPASAAFRKHIVAQVGYLNGTTSGTSNLCVTEAAGYFDGNTNAVTGLQFSFSSGNIVTGTIKVYGLG